MYLGQSLIENWNRSRNDNLFLRLVQISGNAMLLVKVCRYAVVDADFYRVWAILMRENCMCQCCIVDVPRHCTGTRNYSQEQQRDVSIMLSFLISF